MGSAANSRMVALKGPLIHTYVGMATDAAQPSNDALEGENAPRPGTTDIWGRREVSKGISKERQSVKRSQIGRKDELRLYDYR